MSPAESSDKSCIWWLGGQMIAANNVWIDITMSPTKEAGFRCRKNFLVRGPLGGATKKLQASTPDPLINRSPRDPVIALLGCYVTSRLAYIS